jgi:hypothetical protein
VSIEKWKFPLIQTKGDKIMAVRRNVKAGCGFELSHGGIVQSHLQTPSRASASTAGTKVKTLAVLIFAAILSVAMPSLRASGNLDPVIDIYSSADVDAKRAALVQYIWGTSWKNVLSKQPSETRDYYMPVGDDALPRVSSFSNLDRIEQIVTDMCVPAFRHALICHISTAYLFHPRTRNGHVVIVHGGHRCRFDGGVENGDSPDLPYNLDNTIRDLVSAGYAVVAMRMPLYQKPSDCHIDQHDPSAHAEMFISNAQRLRIGNPLQFFLEPVARAVNYIQAKYFGTYHDFNMIGLSGGGWTTTVYAAIDPRIVLSFPVAGSLPLDLDTEGDYEQNNTGLYNIAGYKDLYMLGSLGSRRQSQILDVRDNNFKANSCEAAAYTCQIQTALSGLGSGAFVFDYDEIAIGHQIPLAALSGQILPTLELGSPAPAPGSCSATHSWRAGSLLYIVNQHSDKCLEVAGASMADQAKVQQYQCHEGGNQRWILGTRGEIINQQSGKCLDVADASMADHAKVQQFHCHAGANQLWRVTQRGAIINQNSGKCLDVPSAGTTDQIQIQQFRCVHQASNQRWLFP